jgi:hypothetical protein
LRKERDTNRKDKQAEAERRIEKGKRHKDEGKTIGRDKDEERWRKERYTSLKSRPRKRRKRDEGRHQEKG